MGYYLEQPVNGLSKNGQAEFVVVVLSGTYVCSSVHSDQMRS